MAGGGQKSISPQQAAILRGMAGSAGGQVQRAQGYMPGQQGLLGQQSMGMGNPQAPQMQGGMQNGMQPGSPSASPGGPQIPQWAQGLLNGGLSGQ